MREVTPFAAVRSGSGLIPLSITATARPVPSKPDCHADGAPTVAVVISKKLVCLRLGDMYLTFGSASSAARRLGNTVALTALIELKIFLSWPYAPSCCSYILGGWRLELNHHTHWRVRIP